MTKNIINEVRRGEWIVVDGQWLYNSIFIDCVIELRPLPPGSGIVEAGRNCIFDGCDIVGEAMGLSSHQSVASPNHEPEVMKAMGE